MNTYTTSDNLAPSPIPKSSLYTFPSRSFIRVFIPGKDSFSFEELIVYP